jgi:adenosine deaminase
MDEVDFLGGMTHFIETMEALRAGFAPDTRFYPELALGREQDVGAVASRLDEVLSYGWFKSIDICNNELAQPIRPFQKIYRLAKDMGLTLKAHVGEFGTAEDVLEACQALELNEVHHGIAAAASEPVMHWLSRNKIRLNVCPTSNVMLQRVKSYGEHPIKILYGHGIPVTINTDDLLIFNQSVSQEYLNLFQAGLMSAAELDDIRLTGLGELQSAR